MPKKEKKKKDRHVGHLTKSNLVEYLNADLGRELKHMMFYLHHAALVSGLHAAEIKEFLQEEAAGEFKHVQEFSDVIVGLGGIPTFQPEAFDVFPDGHPHSILEYALCMEDQVVSMYATRIDQAEEFGGPDGKFVQIFLEDQLKDSRTDADKIRQMVKRAR